MLSGSPHSSSSDPQLQGAQAPHLCPLLGAAAHQALGILTPIHLPRSPVSPLSLQPAPQFLTGTPPVLSHRCPGAPLSPCPCLCAQPSGQCHPVSVASGASLLLSIAGHPAPWDTPIWGAPSPGDAPGAPAWPVWAGLPGGLWPRHPARRAPAARPTPGLLPFPSAQPGVGSRGDTGEQTTALPGPDPAGYGAHGVPLQPLVWG